MKQYTEKEGGFAALVTVLMVSTFLMLMSLSASHHTSTLYDEITLRQYRISATEAALACLDRSFLELEHDYFYVVPAEGTVSVYPDLHCTIISVASLDPTGTNGINNPTAQRTIVVEGYSGLSSTTSRSLTAHIFATVLIDSENISLVSSSVNF